jgi:anti-anti-sigma factor
VVCEPPVRALVATAARADTSDMTPVPVPAQRAAEPVVIDLHGELDLFSGPDLQARLRAHAQATDVIIDLTDVTFLDAATARTLAAYARERSVRTIGARPMVRRLFSLARFDEHLHLA